MTSDNALYLDCFSGASGDMLVASLLDLGISIQELEEVIKLLKIPEPYHLHQESGERHGIRGARFLVHLNHAKHEHEDHGHTHHQESEAHNHSHGRTFAEIREMIRLAPLPEAVIKRSISAFERLAHAEGTIHGLPYESVPFHEVGAVDSIIDIVSFCWAIHRLGVQRVIVSPLVDGRGFVRAAHGRLPIPVPATLACLKGIPIRQVDEAHELITPTGATLLAEFGESFIPMPEMQVEKIGHGVGARELVTRPNVVRAILGTLTADISSSHKDQVLVLETHVDDSTGEQLGYLMEKLLQAGALDVAYSPVSMKKSRPGVAITVIAGPDKENELVTLLFKESSAFGLRRSVQERWILEREVINVETPYGSLPVKIGRWNQQIVQRSPEFENCKTAAEQYGVPLMQVYKAALAQNQ